MNNKNVVGDLVLFPELSFKLMEIAFEIHNVLGPGFTEDIYENAFVMELENRQILYEQQKPITVCYKGKPLGIYRLDLLVENSIILELKAVAALNDLCKQQLLSYLKATDIGLGILINFGNTRVEHVRIANTHKGSHNFRVTRGVM
jgi:GxxExxY protein